MNKMSVPGYTVLEKIGAGAMSEVFLGIDKNQRKVAIKILHGFLKDKAHYIERIHQEAKNLSVLKDERIVKTYDILETSDQNIALIQELILGKNLDELKQQTQTTPQIAAIIVSEVLLGLEETHRQHIVHRDLKLENIMITEDGRIKITDFGISKNLETDGLTSTGTVIGSPAYTSPEQISGKAVDQRSDLFSLGVILYQLSANRLPFLGDNYSALLNSILKDTPHSPQKLNPQIHPMLQKIILKSLEKSPEKRYQKAYEFRYDLMQYLDHLGAFNISEILIDFFRGNNPRSIEPDRLLSTLITRASSAIDQGDKKNAIELLQQASLLDSSHPEIKKLLKRLKNNKKPLILLLFLLLIISFVFKWQISSQKNLITEKTNLKPLIPTTAVAMASTIKINEKKIVDIKSNQDIKEIKKLKETTIFFNIDEDITVFLNGEQLPQMAGKNKKVTPGFHSLTLVKPGRPPIVTRVECLANQETIINASSNSGNQDANINR